jgi:MFS family permease
MPPLVWQIALGVLVNRIGSTVVPFLALYLHQFYHYDAITTGKVITCYGAGALLGAFSGGLLIDWLGTRVSLAGAHCASGFVYLALLFPHNYHGFLVNAFLIGLSDVSIRPILNMTVMGAAGPEQRMRANAIRRMALNLGVGSGLAIGGFLYALTPYLLFMLDGLTSFAAAAIFVVFLPRDLSRNRSAGPPLWTALIAPWRDRAFLLLIVAAVCASMVTTQQRNTYPIYLLQAFGIGPAYFGLIMTVNCLVVVCCELPLIHMLRRVDAGWLCMSGALCYGMGFGVLGFGGSHVWVWLGLALWVLGEMLESPAAMSLVQDHAARAPTPGPFFAMFTASFSAVNLFAPGIGGWLYEKGGGGVLWGASFALGILSAGLYYIARFRAKA